MTALARVQTLPHWLRFVANAVADLATSASVAPSSRRLADAMARHAGVANASVVVELGAGTGAITRALLAHLPPHARLYAVDLQPELLEALVQRLRDPRLVPVCADAADLAALPAEARAADVVVSSIGFSMIPSVETRARILATARAVLREGGRFVQFGYLHTRYLCINPSARPHVSRLDYVRFLESRFSILATEDVWLNLFPARVYRCAPAGSAADAPGVVDSAAARVRRIG